MITVIGSRALHYWYPSEARVPRDYDLIGSYVDLKELVRKQEDNVRYCVPSRPAKVIIKLNSGPFIEFEIEVPNTSTGVISYFSKPNPSLGKPAPLMFLSEIGVSAHVAFPEVLLAIKKSHIHVPLKKWELHMQDYHLLKIKTGNKWMREVYDYREAEVSKRTKKTSVKLAMGNDEFFAKSETQVQRVYEHDDLHGAIAYYGRPLYMDIKLDQNKAMCNEELFNRLPHQDKLRAVREEAFSISLERKIIPALETQQPYDSKEAFKWALFRICTTLTSGFFRTFALDHYYEILDLDVDYTQKFLDAVNSGKIKRKPCTI